LSKVANLGFSVLPIFQNVHLDCCKMQNGGGLWEETGCYDWDGIHKKSSGDAGEDLL
jgi:hypothetical protein